MLTVTIEYMLMWTLIWCFALQWVLFRNSKVSFFFTKACPIVAPVEHRHNCSSCLQSCRFQTALGQACSCQDRTWSWNPNWQFSWPMICGVSTWSWSKIPGILQFIYIRYMIVFPYPNPVWTLLPSASLGFLDFFWTDMWAFLVLTCEEFTSNILNRWSICNLIVVICE